MRKLSLCVALVALSQVAISRAAFEETTVINTGVTTTQGPSPLELNGDDTLIITNSGSITTSGVDAHGYVAIGNSNTIINSGSIRAPRKIARPLDSD